jgi:hypothetical protein
MSDLFSHQEEGADVAVTATETPSGVIFLEPSASGAQAEVTDEDSPKRPDFA